MSIQQMFLGSGATLGDPVYIDDVFSTDLWIGNGSTKSITNGIDLDAEGGMVWTKCRDYADNHYLSSTDFSTTSTPYYDALYTNLTYRQEDSNNFGITSFNGNGFSGGGNNATFNGDGYEYVSWSFRKAPGFFDVVHFTGNSNTSTSQIINHSIGSIPGCVIIKNLTSADDWFVWHSDHDNAPSEGLILNNYDASSSTHRALADTPTSTTFTAYDANTNTDGDDYVAYIFANDDERFGDDRDESVIACGSYDDTGFVDLGWEPQWLMTKSVSDTSDYTGDWRIIDIERGFVVGDDCQLFANDNRIENCGTYGYIAYRNSTGFTVESQGNYGTSTIYIAIRKPMND